MTIASERRALAAQHLDIRSREEWGAVTDYSTPRPVETAIALFLHIAVVDDPGDLVGTEHQVMRTIERIGRTRFGASIGISYNAAAFDTGRLYEGQPLERRGAHTVNDLPNPHFRKGSLNHLVRALVLPQQVHDDVTDVQIDAAARWGAAVIRAGFAIPGARWWGHRDVTRKGCPGDAAYRRLGELNALTRRYEANGLEEIMNKQQEQKLDEALGLLRALVPNTPRKVITQGSDVGKLSGDGKPVAELWRWQLETLARTRGGAVDEAEVARLVLAGLDDVALTDEQVRSIIDAIPGQVKQALREGTG
jgi:hypothetical protein